MSGSGGALIKREVGAREMARKREMGRAVTEAGKEADREAGRQAGRQDGRQGEGGGGGGSKNRNVFYTEVVIFSEALQVSCIATGAPAQQ